MNRQEIELFLAFEGPLIPAREAEELVEDKYGLYSIVIDDPRHLSDPFSRYMTEKDHKVIYLGKAEKQYFSKRLVENDLRHKGQGSFFRSLGAVLGYRPEKGSLVGKANQNNYRFNPSDTPEIVTWINNLLSVRYLQLESDEIALELKIIDSLRPVFNIKGNPDVLQDLLDARRACKEIAIFAD
jgi:hypothetical protein